MKKYLLLPVLLFFYSTIVAQTFTMGKKCKEQNAKGIGLLKEKKYQEAFDTFIAMGKDCTTKDAKEAVAVGTAEALNGMGKYDEAIAASNTALKVTKDKSLNGLFQKAVAQSKLKQYEAASATFSQIITLTEKNQDTKARASNYATMSQVYWRQLNKKDSALYFLDKAKALDPANPDFVIIQGDMLMDQKKYDKAFAQYDKAVSMGKTDLEMYEILSEARIKMLMDKYHTTNAQELRSKMTAKEKEELCKDLKKAQSLGSKDMQKDMFTSLVCQ